MTMSDENKKVYGYVYYEIASKKSDPMMERLLESIKREGRRMNFKVIK